MSANEIIRKPAVTAEPGSQDNGGYYMRYKLVALDVDGTLLNQDRQISSPTRKAIRRVRELGIEVTLCTGRMFCTALPYAEELEVELPLVTYNGGLVMKPRTKEIIYQRSLPREYAIQIIKGARQQGFTINYYYEDRLLVEKITEQNQLYSNWSGVPLEQVEDLAALTYDPTKILLIGKQESLASFEKDCQGIFGAAVYITKSWPTFLEFLHPEATKGRGLKALTEYLGIQQSHVIGIGDSYNDLEMFRHSGLAVAMGNADEVIRQAADYVTATNEEEGVAQALKKLILEAAPLSQVR